MNETEKTEKKHLGGDLVIPVAALAFTLYYFSTIIDSPWTAQVSAVFIGAILIVLLLIFIIKSVKGFWLSWTRIRNIWYSIVVCINSNYFIRN